MHTSTKKWLALLGSIAAVGFLLILINLPYSGLSFRAQAQYGPIGTIIFVPAPTREAFAATGVPLNPNPRFPANVQGSVIYCRFNPPFGDRVPCYTDEQIRRFFQPADMITVDSQFLNVRERPAMGARIITYLVQGNERPLYGISRFGDWGYIRLNDGRWGWVALRLTTRSGANLPVIYID